MCLILFVVGGEQPLESYEFCNLGSINVENLYNEDIKNVDWDLFEYVIKTSMRFLDDVIDVNDFVLPEFRIKVVGNRKIGLGVAGFANLLIKLGIRYDSEECLQFIDKFFGFKQQVEKQYNTELALEKGNFPNWHESIYAKLNIPARCATVSTQAPTGSISSILNTTAYGIEPLFGVVYPISSAILKALFLSLTKFINFSAPSTFSAFLGIHKLSIQKFAPSLGTT